MPRSLLAVLWLHSCSHLCLGLYSLHSCSLRSILHVPSVPVYYNSVHLIYHCLFCNGTCHNASRFHCTPVEVSCYSHCCWAWNEMNSVCFGCRSDSGCLQAEGTFCKLLVKRQFVHFPCQQQFCPLDRSRELSLCKGKRLRKRTLLTWNTKIGNIFFGTRVKGVFFTNRVETCYSTCVLQIA
jgi:hypothetical protein